MSFRDVLGDQIDGKTAYTLFKYFQQGQSQPASLGMPTINSGAPATQYGVPVNPDIIPTGFDQYRITQGFGSPQTVRAAGEQIHHGIDFAAPGGTPIPSPIAGTVVEATNNRGYGNNVVIKGNDGRHYRFSHLSGFGVEPGQTINQNDILGQVGTTGVSTGNHLDYRVYQ